MIAPVLMTAALFNEILFNAAVGNACHAVDGERILMRDVAAMDARFASADADTVVGYSPQPAGIRVFWPSELKHLAEQNGVASEAPFTRICFERRTHVLTTDEVLRAVGAWAPAGSSVEVAEISRFPVPAGELIVPMPLAVPTAPDGTSILRGYVIYGERQRFPTWMRVKVRVRRRLIVAAADLRAGQRITDESLREEIREGGIESIHYLSDSNVIVGHVAARRIQAGAAMTLDALEPIKQVLRGAIVKVEVRSGAARLVLDAEAEADGRTGDVIPIRNPSSGRAFRGKIVGENRVEVAPVGGTLWGDTAGTEKR